MHRIALAAGLALTLTAAPAVVLAASPAAAVAAHRPSSAVEHAPVPGEAPVAVPADLTGKEVSFPSGGGLTLHGTVLSPVKASPGRPGMVLVHGAGTGTPRAKLMGEAVEFARRGVSVLIYDKRSEGYSLFQRSYSTLADDALGAVAALRAQPGVDPAKVGVWGLSEGGWIAPLTASRSRDIAFVVVVGANALAPLRQQTWAVAAGLRKAGVTGSLVDRAEPTLYRAIADGGMFPEPWYDPEPVLAAVRQPVLAIWGVHDLLTPPEETPPIFARALEKGGNRHYTFRFFPGADHAAHLTPDGGVTRLPALAPGYADLVGSWIQEVVSGRPPLASTSGPAPEQVTPTVPVDPPAPWESAPVQLAVMLLLIVAFAAYPLTALARRLRGRPRTARPAAPRVLSAAGLISVLGSFAFLAYLIMTGGKLAAPGPVLLGRPVVWLALQASALTTVATSVWTVRAWRKAETRSERVRLGLLLTGGAAFLPWALYWGLLLP
ncbi:prolyl oligopeptidase family serine peptidase [Planomonospora sp. ID91781]|uniref:alpha/beta hydrolase family protein n=1 Tax=Planomonospora sp. ID91781 TaxID=2738135 RepID=UPI0018C3DC3B|nr:prolyl oligopeptidase family serine peptidase [Planomonospora sp. ID91781]MBG0824212.1 prolyl oligopeptidase family serine peptidase [Planomonospora sp. ID91781]